jgi:hypothetical protein
VVLTFACHIIYKTRDKTTIFPSKSFCTQAESNCSSFNFETINFNATFFFTELNLKINIANLFTFLYKAQTKNKYNKKYKKKILNGKKKNSHINNFFSTIMSYLNSVFIKKITNDIILLYNEM